MCCQMGTEGLPAHRAHLQRQQRAPQAIFIRGVPARGQAIAFFAGDQQALQTVLEDLL